MAVAVAAAPPVDTRCSLHTVLAVMNTRVGLTPREAAAVVEGASLNNQAISAAGSRKDSKALIAALLRPGRVAATLIAPAAGRVPPRAGSWASPFADEDYIAQAVFMGAEVTERHTISSACHQLCAGMNLYIACPSTTFV